MALFNVYDSVKKAIQDIVSPEIEGLKGQIQAVHSEIRRLDEKFTTEIRRLDEKIDSRNNKVLSEIRRLDEKMTTEIRRLGGKIDALDRRLNEKIDMLDKKLDLAIQIHDRPARVEAKLGLT